MATTAGVWTGRTTGRAPKPDVVAGLLELRGAGAVARAAVREAIARGSRIHFLQAHPTDVEPDDVSAHDSATFEAALRALRDSPEVPVTFEVTNGDPGAAFVERSGTAGVLVVGGCGESAAEVAAFCQAHATCDVLTVHADAYHGAGGRRSAT